MMMNKEIETDRKEILPLFFCSKTFLPHSSICQKPTAKVLPDTLSRYSRVVAETDVKISFVNPLSMTSRRCHSAVRFQVSILLEMRCKFL